jgi:hypothetical protein
MIDQLVTLFADASTADHAIALATSIAVAAAGALITMIGTTLAALIKARRP